MKKQFGSLIWLLGILLLGAFGACVRGVELAFYIDPQTNLYSASGFLAWILPLLSVAAAVVSYLFAMRRRNTKDAAFTESFAVTNKIEAAALIVSGLLLVSAGVMKTLSAVTEILESILPYVNAFAMPFRVVLRMIPLADIAYGLITLFAGVAILSLTKVRNQRQTNEFTRFFATIPIFWACFLVIMTFMEHPVEPVMQIFAYDLLGSAAIVLSVYSVSAFLFGRGNGMKMTGVSLAALYFVAVTAGGRAMAFLLSNESRFLTEVPFRMVTFIAMFIYIIVNLIAIGRNERE